MDPTHPFLRGVAPGESFDLLAYACKVGKLAARYQGEAGNAAVARAMKLLQGDNQVAPVAQTKTRDRSQPSMIERVYQLTSTTTPINLGLVAKMLNVSRRQVATAMQVLYVTGRVRRSGRGEYVRPAVAPATAMVKGCAPQRLPA